MYQFKTNQTTPFFIPEEFINVKTGENQPVSPKVRDQIEYHTRNITLTHLVMSALHQYLEPKMSNGTVDEVMKELAEIKQLMKNGISMHPPTTPPNENSSSIEPLDTKDVDDILEAFGG